MPTVDPVKGPVMGGLQPVFNPNQVVPLIRPQKFQDISVYTIRSCGHRQAHDIIRVQRLIVKPFQVRRGGIGVGKGLEIRDEFFGPVAFLNKPPGADNLLIDRKPVVDPCPCSGASLVTKDTAFSGKGSIPIWAAQPGVQGDLLNPFPEDFS